MFNRKVASQDEQLIKDLRKQLKERDERIQALSSALEDAHITVNDLESALKTAGAAIGTPNPQIWRETFVPDAISSSRLGSSILGSPPRHVDSTFSHKDLSMLTQSGIQPPLELSATFLDSQQYLSNSNINHDMYDITEFRNDLQVMQNQLAAKDKQIEELLAEAEELKNHIKTVNLEYNTFRKTILDMSVCNSDLRVQLAQAQQELGEKERAYNSLMASMESRDKVTELLSSVTQRPRSARDTSNLSASKKETLAMHKTIRDQEAEIVHLREVLAEKETEIARLITTCDEAVQMRNEIQSLLDQSIQTNQMLKDKIEIMSEEAKLASVQAYQGETFGDNVQEIAIDNTMVPYPIYLNASRNSKDDMVDATIVQLQARVAELETELASSLNTSSLAKSLASPDVSTLLTSKDEEISLLKKQVLSLERSLLSADNKQTASQRASPSGSRGPSPGVSSQWPGLQSSGHARGCFSEVGGTNYLKLMKRTRLLIDEASDVLSGSGRRTTGTAMSTVSASGKTSSDDQMMSTSIHLQAIAELREANARIINSIIEKDDQIADMLEIVSISEAELTDIKLLMEEKDRNLIQLTEDLHRKEKELDALVKEVKNAFSEVLELTNTVRSRDALIKDLSDGLTESQDLINQIAAENTALVQKMNEKNNDLEKLLKESAAASIELFKIKEQGSISKDEHARLLASIKDSISFIRRCAEATVEGGEDVEGNIIKTKTMTPGVTEMVASPIHISGKCDVIVGVVNYLTSKAEELKMLSASYNVKHGRLLAFLNDLTAELASVQTFASILPEDSQLRSLMVRLGEAIETDLQEVKESLGSADQDGKK
ncbi:Hypothetical protein DHA2_16811 [Giardia duodenalis]|uniref:ZipA n=1 Tax=Giardia intestinalis TaxID=5741 RepID=V6TQC0_GIAIN|nr:Hypothetical protein DHA2_16811 [Giardia intestinalis]